MPKKKKKVAARPNRSGGHPATRQVRGSAPVPGLLVSPAQAWMKVAAENPDALSVLEVWPWTVGQEGHLGRTTSLQDMATTSKQTVREAVEALLMMEEAGLAEWDQAHNAYWLTTPPDAPS